MGLRAEPRLVQIDGHTVDVPPAGHLLVVNNDDRPGVIGRVGTVLRSPPVVGAAGGVAGGVAVGAVWVGGCKPPAPLAEPGEGVRLSVQSPVPSGQRARLWSGLGFW